MGDGLHRRDARSRTAAGFRRIPQAIRLSRRRSARCKATCRYCRPRRWFTPTKRDCCADGRFRWPAGRIGCNASGRWLREPPPRPSFSADCSFSTPAKAPKGPSGLRQKRQKLTPKAPKRSPHGSTDRRQPTRGMTRRPPEQGNAGTRKASPPPFRTHATHAPAALAAHYGNTGDRTAASGQGTAAGPTRTGKQLLCPFVYQTHGCGSGLGNGCRNRYFRKFAADGKCVGFAVAACRTLPAGTCPDRRTGSHPAGPHPGAPVADCAPVSQRPGRQPPGMPRRTTAASARRWVRCSRR